MRHHPGPHPDRRGRRSACLGALTIAVFAVVVPLSGCSSSAKAPASGGATATRVSGTPPASGTATSPSPAANTSPAAAASATADPSAFQLVPNTGPNNAYTISVPSTWQIEDVAPTIRRYVMFTNKTRVAQFTVNCAAGGTVADLSATDARLVQTIGGKYAVNGIIDVTVASLHGKQTEYTAPLTSTGTTGGPNQETRVLYLQGTACAWQILMQTYGNGLLQHYTPLFDAILATFKPATPGG